MKREIYNKLIDWKISKDRKPLVLEGARQVGKTYILKELGQREYSNMVYLNCHNNPFAAMLFVQDFNISRILEALEAYSGQHIVAGETLIFIDEIQEAPQALPSLKYFCEDAREQHVVVAGSLLGVAGRPGESYPVGKVDLLRMFPMTFEEFLWACGDEKLADLVRKCDWEVMKALDARLQERLRQYYYVGGMPEAVLSYTTEHDIPKVRKIQKAILTTYDHDFAKHAGDEVRRIRMVWNSLPSQLAKENKKFIYNAVKKGGRAKEFEKAIQWLVDAGLAYQVFRCKQPATPLKFYQDLNAFKLYLLDVGLLGAMAEAPARDMLISNEVFKSFKGAFTENYFFEQVKPFGDVPTFYFSKDNSTMEVDALLQTDERIIPVEVKAEENVKAKSLSLFVKEDFAEYHLKALRCSMKSYVDQGWMENIPLYSIGSYLASQCVDGTRL